MTRSHTIFRIGSLLAVILIVLAQITALPVVAGSEIRWEPTQKPLTQALQAPRTTSITTEFILYNDSAADAQYNITFPDLPAGWKARTGTPNPVSIGTTKNIKIAVLLDIPDNASAGIRVITIRATRISPAPALTEDAFLNLTLVAQTTPPAADGTCPEPNDPGNDIGSASLIRVDKEEGHGICTTGDIDWFKFGAIGGKYYTIDITQMDKGLDLSLDLYDENGNLIDSDDDFPRPDNPYDTRPRIQSFRAPVNGFYYFRVRDTLDIGGLNLTYRVVVLNESYGPEPPPVGSICNDRYEPDGLPELAHTINPNDTQKDHRLCPAGDADWVKFFGLAGYTYYIYTNTRPYAGSDGGPVPGADTILFIFSRDGQTLIDANNNIANGTTLDSEITFRPSADGIYYAQVKNVGDIGGMLIRYDLSLKACPPEQPACGPPPDIVPPPPAPAPAPAAFQPSAPGQPPAQAPQFLDSSQPSDRSQASVTAGAAQTGVFSAPAFENLWKRVDLPIASGRVVRSWIWGPAPRISRSEAYTQAPDGLRSVLYFDKGRMELANRDTKQVSFGLLVSEMVHGQIQVGDATYMQHAPADIGIVGDIDDTRSPTYATLAGFTGAVADRTNQLPNETLARDGSLGSYQGSNHNETHFSHFISTTGHNIPAVFWDYLHAQGLIYNSGYTNGSMIDWVAMVGYPISEAYWVRVRTGGIEHDVLVQAFERRILTYTPDELPTWRVQMGNVGRHYYRWRYDDDLPS